ncbi:MAG TPA: phosphatase [Ruminococcaceae bacterium]|nr:phosphatase [Oscillospiraceae bacterium]
MNKRKYPKVAAVIDIGSSELKLRIAQLRKGQICDLDRLVYPLALGHEVFTEKKISFECIREMSHALSGFTALMKEYGITQYRAVATTALREAENRAFVLDQLRVQNNLNVEVLEDDHEKTLIYSEILTSLKAANALAPGCSLLSFIGSGTIGAAVYDGNAMICSQNIPIGALKLHDMLGSIQEKTDDFSTVVEEYLESMLNYQNISQFEIHNVILTGNEMELIAQLCHIKPKKNIYAIPVKEISRLYRRIRTMRADKIAQYYNISEKSAELLYSALAIYLQLICKTDAEQILSPRVDLWDALMRQMLIPKQKDVYWEHVRDGAISCACHIAESYHCNRTHVDTVRRIACTIFDRLKPLHGLGPEQRLILELACILHESGHFVSVKDHLEASFDIIRHTDIYGMTNQNILLAAYVARYNEYIVPDFHSMEYTTMSEQNRIVIAKLVAIFRLANALDKSQKQKIRNIKVKLLDEQMVVSAESNENLSLEKWAFEQCSTFFKDVFGLYPVLKIKQNLI